ncbi:hypothetical protein AB1Y20_016427 [Prymnesium parvum]|uniref:Uncharacterized protein n=1 Tax=Prymnesium parvum TaxID=97485 RepID=A0AB34IGR2_PRYPA
MGACLRPPPPGGGVAPPPRSLSADHVEPPARHPSALALGLAHTAAPTEPVTRRPITPPHHDGGELPMATELEAAVGPSAAASDVTICGAASSRVPAILLLSSNSGVHAPSSRREGLPTAPAASCCLPASSCELPPAMRGKGAKHARLCAGPWASALSSMPPMPLTGAKRAQAGLADVPLSSSDISAVRRERAARALASILPWAAAGFVLGDSPEMVASRSASETTKRLVSALSAYGVSSTEAAYSALGRLMSWVILHHPEATSIEGSHLSDFLAAERPSATTLTALAWPRDHCGLAIPARGPVCRPYRCRPPVAQHSKESLSIGAVVSLEHIAANHPSEWVRGQAAGWSVLSRLALRLEQAQSCVINAFVSHSYDGEEFTIAVGAVRHDKHPNPSKRRPRPIWGVIDDLDHSTGRIREALLAMLSGVEASQFLLRDTDSPDGDPTKATTWVSAPLRGSPRTDASLQALLRLPPASLSSEEAGQFHGHSAKRFLLNVAEASAAFTPVEACEVGRFSMSTAQSPDLEPVAAMLQAHSLRASVLPDIYAGKAKVARVFDLLVKAHLTLRSARRALASDPSLVSVGDASWGLAGPFGERPVPQALSLTRSE